VTAPEGPPAKARTRAPGLSEQRERWLREHPFLYRTSTLQAAVEEAARGLPPVLERPDWTAYGAEYLRGIPLLRSPSAQFDPAPEVAAHLGFLAGQASLAAPAGALREGCSSLRAQLAAPQPEQASEQANLVRLAIDGAPPEGAPANAGLVRWLSWAALASLLRPVSEELQRRFDGDAWNRPDCPVCGALPMLAQLVDHAAGRRRLLSCGCCRTRWGWQRLGCPHCGNEDEATLEILEPDGSEVRLDVCRACDGYLKTYAGEGREELLLADWTTLHLDAAARGRGLSRRGASVYEL
jgi:FdhE protein